MTTIQQTIASLDDMRGKIEPQEWVSDHFDDENVYFGTNEEDIGACFDDKSQGTDSAEYIVALHNSYPTLRNTVLEAERYKRAGEALAEAIERLEIDGRCEYNCKGDIKEQKEAALIIYRQAVEQKEV